MLKRQGIGICTLCAPYASRHHGSRTWRALVSAGEIRRKSGAGERTRTADLLITKKSWRQDRRVIENELFPKWRTLRANEIRRRDVRQLVEAIAERPAPIAANRIRALISKIFNFGISREMVEFNPCAQLERPAPEHRRDRVLTDAEVRAFWTALDHEPPEMAAAFRLRLVTAQRGVEVHNMRWTDVDLDSRWWTVPASDAKNGLPHRVPLNALANRHPAHVVGRLPALAANRRYGMAASAPMAGRDTRPGPRLDRRRPCASTARPPCADGPPRQAGSSPPARSFWG